MNQNLITQTVQAVRDADELFKIVTGLYWAYIDSLETTLKNIPATETELFFDVQRHLKEIQSAMEHDLSLFDKAVNQDKENLNQLKDQLKINEIYKNLR